MQAVCSQAKFLSIKRLIDEGYLEKVIDFSQLLK
jgi:hypothetical protein